MFAKKKPKIKPISNNQVETMSSPTALTSDKNNDGVADYLQRDALPSLLKDIKDTTLAHVDTQKELENLKMIWRGYEYSPGSSKFEPVSPPMINELGIKQLSMMLDPIANKHTMNSNISPEWAHDQTKRLSVSILFWMMKRRKIWGVSSSDRTPIIEMLDAFIFNIYSRAIDDGQRRHDDNRLSLQGQNNPTAQPGI